jgi:hypothetical protein
MQDQQVVQAFLSDAPQEAFTDGIGSGCMIWCFENLDVTCPRHTVKARPELPVVIANEIFGRLSIGRGFTQRYARPSHPSATVSRPRG